MKLLFCVDFSHLSAGGIYQIGIAELLEDRQQADHASLYEKISKKI